MTKRLVDIDDEMLEQAPRSPGHHDPQRHGQHRLDEARKAAYFKPAHGLAPDLVDRYGPNRLTVTRQLRYDAGSGKTLDLALLVNGISTRRDPASRTRSPGWLRR